MAPGAVYHITQRANRRRTIFHKEQDYAAFLSLLGESVIVRPMRMVAFCLMPNHWHLVLWPDVQMSVPAYMHWLTSTHVRRYHAHYGLVGMGHLYQGRYGSQVCDQQDGLIRIVRYVEANALSASLVQRAEHWQWSSLSVRLNHDPDQLLCECPVQLPTDWAAIVNDVPRKNETPIC